MTCRTVFRPDTASRTSEYRGIATLGRLVTGAPAPASGSARQTAWTPAG